MHLATTQPARRTAPEASATRPENRVWGFFEDGVKRTWKIDAQVVEQHLEKTTTESRTASGVPYWLSPDPIGEAGGINLYGYVGNDPVNFWDPLGLSILPAQMGMAVSRAIAAGDVATLKLLAAGGGISAKVCNQAIARANQVNHVFNQARHGLSGMVRKLFDGNNLHALKAMEKAAAQVCKNKKITGKFEETVRMGSNDVTIRGFFDGTNAKIGTAFIAR